jgi:hypothetical protein
VTQAGLLTVFLTLVWTPAVAASSLERRIEARIQDAFARYDILSRQELECSTLLVRKSSNARVARIGVHPLQNRRCGGDPNTAPRRFECRTSRLTLRVGRAGMNTVIVAEEGGPST